MEFQERVSFLQLPETPLSPAVGTEPSVLNNTKITFSNTSPTNVTNFVEGQEGQTIFLFGDGFTTLVNNSNLVLGSNRLLALNTVTVLTQRANKWYPLASTAPAATIVPQTINIQCGELHTVGVPDTYEEYPNTQLWFRTVVSLSAFTQFRAYYIVRDVSAPSGMTLRVEYSLNGTTGWTTFWTGPSFTANGQTLTALAGIPAGALNDPVYLRVLISAPSSGSTVRITSFDLRVS